MPSPSLRDIAKVAGVSHVTVGRALRNHPKVSASQRKRIQELATKMGYKKNPLISAWMKARRSQGTVNSKETIAFLSFDEIKTFKEADNFYRLWHAGAQSMAQELGYGFNTISAKDYKFSWQSIARVLTSRGIRGILLAPMLGKTFSMDLNDFIAVSVEKMDHSPHIDHVLPNHFEGMQLALDEGIRRGYRRIGYIHPGRLYPTHLRWKGAYLSYREFLSANEQVEIIEAPASSAETPERFQKWFNSEKPDLVICPNPIFFTHLKSMGLCIPEDCGVIHLEWKPSWENLTGIDQNFRMSGEIALKMLANRLERNEVGYSKRPISVLVEPKWIEGQTLRSLR
ncbi:MAG: LacI family DNA-binding transcriptional regulator [Verrucomicrobiota bacterium]